MSDTTITESNADPKMLEDYHAWMAMGKGGTSHDWAGYLGMLNVEKTMAFDDTISPEPYDNPEKYASGWSKATQAQKASVQQSFLNEPLPQRQGPRSHAKHYVWPQREKNADDPIDPEIKQSYEDAFTQLGETHTASTEWATSMLEKRGRALFIKQSLSLHPLAAPTQREIGHIHGSDSSGHVTLSFPDAKEVIAKGWGERHRLSGTSMLHLGYTMLYVPRDLEEVDVLMKIMQAGVDFMHSA